MTVPPDSNSSQDTTSSGLVNEGKVMSLFEHLNELRARVIKSFLGVLGFFFLCLTYSTEIIQFLERPLRQVIDMDGNSLHFTGPLDVFLTSIRLSVLSAVILSCPIWLFQFWRFFEPALYEKERRYILPFVLTSVLLFFVG